MSDGPLPSEAKPAAAPRTIRLLGATGIGVGAIVGGGVLVLAGVAFRSTGPGSILAFAANGLVAVLTALSFAEMSTAFPESGGAYIYAKKVLSVRVAFAVGWVLWFAYIVAGVLYALGFAEYAALVVQELWRRFFDEPPGWLAGRTTVTALALAATGAYTLSLIRRGAAAGQWATVGKLVVFAVLIVAGIFVLSGRPVDRIGTQLTPLLPRGGLGLLEAMGFTFIALQGFEVIAAVAGEVRGPERTIPRAMLLSLAIALVVYLPLLFVVCTAGVPPGQSITDLSRRDPSTVMALAVRTYLGEPGYWLVVLAAILSTLSALQANILAASRVAHTMSRDRTLPVVLAQTYKSRSTPVAAIYASALAMVVTLLIVPDVAAAGAAASLIFLVSFALAHWTSLLARRRREGEPAPFSTPFFPSVPVLGGVACAALALFQAVAVPAAGAIAAVWLALGVLLYASLFARRAEMVDALAEAADPGLVRFRGRSPLVLVPVANPNSAHALVEVAAALAPPRVGRVLLLSVVTRPQQIEEAPARVALAQEVLQSALTASFELQVLPEALVTIGEEPWPEIARVAAAHHCEGLLLGLHRLDGASAVLPAEEPLEDLLNRVDCDVTIVHAVPEWRLDQVRRVLIPIGGKGQQDELRARLLGSLSRTAKRELVFLQVLPPSASTVEVEESRRALLQLALDESPTTPVLEVLKSDDVAGTIAGRAEASDLLVLGLPRLGGHKQIGALAREVAAHVRCPTIMISRGG